MKKSKQKTVTKTVHYKIARYLKGDHKLQRLLQKSLDKCPTVGSRSQTTGLGDDGKRRVISHENFRGMLCGWLVDYTPGNSALGLIIDEDAANLKIQNLLPQVSGKQQHEYAEGIIYFGIMDNHILVTQSTGLLTSHFERYLNWIIHEKTGTLPEGNWIQIADQVSNPLKGQRGITGVKSIRLSDIIGSTAVAPAAKAKGSEGSTKERVKIKDTRFITGILDLLHSLGGPDDFTDVLNPANVEMTLEIVSKNLRQGKQEPFLDNLAGVFRHQDNIEVAMDLVGGGTITSTDYKISHPQTVPGNGGIPDSTVLFEKMSNMLQGLVTERRIPSDP